MESGQESCVEEYLNIVCSQVKCREVHEQIRQELLGHLEECAAESGSDVSREEAMGNAVERMGDPVDLGRKLHRAHRPRTEWSLLLLAGVFLALRLVMLFSIGTHSIDYGWFKQSTIGWYTQGFNLFTIGIVVAPVIYFIDYRKIKAKSWWIFWTTLLLWFPFYLSRSHAFNIGVPLYMSYADYGKISLLLLVVALAGIFSEVDWSRRTELLKVFGLLVISFAAYWPYGPLWVSFFYMVVFFMLMRSSGAKALQCIAVTAPLAAMGVLYATFVLRYPWGRLLLFLCPYTDWLGAGYTNVQIIRFLSSAGAWGHAMTFTIQNYLPGYSTGLILTYAIHVFGWVFGIGVFALIIALMVRLGRVTRQANNRYGRLLVTGITGVFAIEFFWNMLMSVGLLPVLSVDMPFLSYGGPQLVVQMAVMALLLSVYRRKDIIVPDAGATGCMRACTAGENGSGPPGGLLRSLCGHRRPSLRREPPVQ